MVKDIDVKLSQERTILSNERTMLSHMRTAFALIIFGIAVLNFLKNGYALYTGTISIILGAIWIIIGLVLYKIRYNRIKKLRIQL